MAVDGRGERCQRAGADPAEQRGGAFGKAPFYCPELRGAAGVRGAEEGLCVREGDGIYQA